MRRLRTAEIPPSTTPSVSNWRSNRNRPAPSDNLTAISRWRAADLDRSSVVTFTQASRSNSVAVPSVTAKITGARARISGSCSQRSIRDDERRLPAGHFFVGAACQHAQFFLHLLQRVVRPTTAMTVEPLRGRDRRKYLVSGTQLLRASYTAPRRRSPLDRSRQGQAGRDTDHGERQSG